MMVENTSAAAATTGGWLPQKYLERANHDLLAHHATTDGLCVLCGTAWPCEPEQAAVFVLELQ